MQHLQYQHSHMAAIIHSTSIATLQSCNEDCVKTWFCKYFWVNERPIYMALFS